MIVARGLGAGSSGSLVAFGLTRGKQILESIKQFLTLVLEIRN